MCGLMGGWEEVCSWNGGCELVHPRFVPQDPPVAPNISTPPNTHAPQMMEGRQEGGPGTVLRLETISLWGEKGPSEEGLWKWLAAAVVYCPLPSAFMSLLFLLCETRLQEPVGFIRPFSISVWLKSLCLQPKPQERTRLLFIKYRASSCLNHSLYISN